MKINWAKTVLIQSGSDYRRFVQEFLDCKPNLSSFDTETTGLNIVLDRPFLIQIGFCNTKTLKGNVYLIYFEDDVELAMKTMKTFWLMAEKTKYLTGANIKYDLHMVANVGVPYPGKNVTDIQTMIRLCSDAIPKRMGGPSLALTDYASKYIDPAARGYDRAIQAERGAIAKQINGELKDRLKGKGWTLKRVEDFLKDPINDIDDMGEELATDYRSWYGEIPKQIRRNMTKHVVERDDIPYNLVPREIMNIYAEYDVIYTLEIATELLPIVRIRGQMATFKRENDIILPFWEMERVGFAVDLDYLKESQVVLKNYIIKLRKEMSVLAREEVSVNQSKRIPEIFKDLWDVEMESTNKETLQDLTILLVADGNKPEAIRLIELIQELRSLQKWYVTYLMSYINSVSDDGRIYTSINQSGAVTGRVSSNFQQFPRGSIKDGEGNTLFTPRQFIIKPDDVDVVVWIDYSQIELRFQALYTILLGFPDKNLCRAYMPYECYTQLEEGRMYFDYNNQTHIKNFAKYDWTTEEGNDWHPTDVHAETTAHAFPDLQRGTKEFTKLRGSVGKTTNFAKNYGATRKVIHRTFASMKFSEEQITMIDEAYFKAFPSVKLYMEYCYRVAGQGYMTNLFDRKYYGISGHNGMNALVQGSAADFMKQAIIDIAAFLKEGGYKTKMVLPIHDEIVFNIYEGERYLIPVLQELMQTYEGSKIPIVAEAEFSFTSWADAEELEYDQDFLNYNFDESSSHTG